MPKIIIAKSELNSLKKEIIAELLPQLEESVQEMIDGISLSDLDLSPLKEKLRGIKGEDGYTPIKNKDFFDGTDGRNAPTLEEILGNIPKPKDGKDADETKIVMDVLRQIPKPKDGKNGIDGSPDTGKQIVKKLESLEGEDRLDYNALKNRPSSVTQQIYGGGGGITFHELTGDVNGINNIFRTTANIKAIILDGVTYFEDNGYTLSNGTITTTVIPQGFIKGVN